MKFNFFFIVLCSYFVSYAQSGKLKMRGQVENPINAKIAIHSVEDRPVKEVTLEESNTFELTLEIEKPGYYFLNHDRASAYIYLAPGDDLWITADGENFTNTVFFKGTGATRNNYLVEKDRIDYAAREDLAAYFPENETTYQKQVQAIKKRSLDRLETLKVENFFKKDELKFIEYTYLFSIYSYSNSMNFYFGKDIEVTNAFLEPLEGFDYDNSNEFDLQPYYRYLVSSRWKKEIKNSAGYTEMNRVFHSIKSYNIKIDVFISFYYSIAKDANKAKDYFKLIENNSPNTEFIASAKEKLDKVLRNRKGVPSPKFALKDPENKTYHLDDFKGKYVYIDIWATWCAPCIQQIPALKKLEHDYKDHDIVFVSISVDKKGSYEKWKNTIKKKELGGIQLFAENSFDSDFIKAYGVSSIPRFIIIDREGNIFDGNASKPSSGETQKTFASLFKK